MSVEAVARKDFEDAVRSRLLVGLSALFVLLVSAGVYIVWTFTGDPPVSSNTITNHAVVKDGIVTYFVPLIALVIAYGAVVGERESGSLKLLLSLPHSRADVVFGKVIGRSAAIAAPIVVGFLLPGLLLAILPQITFQPGYFVGYTLFTAFLGVVFVSLAVGFSAAMSSQRLALAGALGIYFLFVPLWGVIRLPLQFYLGLGGGTPGWLPLSGTELLDFLQLINPTGSFKIVVNSFMAGSLFVNGQQAPDVSMQFAAISMLAAWLLVPPLLGVWQFENSDL